MQPFYHSDALESLPIDAHNFSKLCLSMTDEVGKLAWQQLRTTAWAHNLTPMEELAAHTKHIQLFLQHRLSCKIGTFSLRLTVAVAHLQLSLYPFEPPTRVCIDPECSQRLTLPLCASMNQEVGA
jgi:hypothetical protein